MFLLGFLDFGKLLFLLFLKFLFGLAFLLEFLLGFLICPIIVSEDSDVLLVFFESFEPEHHVVDTDFDAMADVFVVGLFEKKFFLGVIASDTE